MALLNFQILFYSVCNSIIYFSSFCYIAIVDKGYGKANISGWWPLKHLKGDKKRIINLSYGEKLDFFFCLQKDTTLKIDLVTLILIKLIQNVTRLAKYKGTAKKIHLLRMQN